MKELSANSLERRGKIKRVKEPTGDEQKMTKAERQAFRKKKQEARQEARKIERELQTKREELQDHTVVAENIKTIANTHVGIYSSFLRRELKKGIIYELDTRTKVNEARRIALENLMDDPNYYKKLEAAVLGPSSIKTEEEEI